MDFKQYIPPVVLNFFKGGVSETDFFKNTKKGSVFNLKGNRVFRFDADLKDLEDAIKRATDIEYPSRQLLYRVYDEIVDLHVKSQIRTATFEVIKQPWQIIDENGKRDEDAEKLLQKMWFYNYNKRVVETEFWGHSLIYFWMDEETGEIKETKLFPRVHVNPEKNSLIPDLGHPEKMIPFDNDVFKSIFIEVGESDDLGLLKDISRWCILKNYSIKDWARSSEKWGDPHIVLNSSTDNETENNEKAQFLNNFGNNGWLMIGEDDKVQLLEKKSVGAAHLIFLDFIKIANEENSKGINGQVATADQKAFVGAADIQKDILDGYTESRLRSLMFFHNEITIPFLVAYNGGNSAYNVLAGKKWMPVSLMNEEIKEKKKEKPAKPEDDEEEKPNADPKNVKNPFM